MPARFLCAGNPLFIHLFLFGARPRLLGQRSVIYSFSCSALARSLCTGITLFMYLFCSALARSYWAGPVNYLLFLLSARSRVVRCHPVIYLFFLRGARPSLPGRARYLFILSCSTLARSLCAGGPLFPGFFLRGACSLLLGWVR